MPRLARKKSKTGIYHIMVRGINRQAIFRDDEDRQRYIETLSKVKEISRCKIYGYCLMENHVHLLLEEGTEELSHIMKRLGTSYAYWYNKKYERIGHLFQDRFKSENVEDDNYFLGVLRYIHQNPLKAGLADTIEQYAWSSYRAYINADNSSLIDIQFVLDMFSPEPDKAVEKYTRYMGQAQQEGHLDVHEKKKCSDAEIRHAVEQMMVNKSACQLDQLEKEERDQILRTLKKIDGVSIRQIERVTGIGRNIVAIA